MPGGSPNLPRVTQLQATGLRFKCSIHTQGRANPAPSAPHGPGSPSAPPPDRQMRGGAPRFLKALSPAHTPLSGDCSGQQCLTCVVGELDRVQRVNLKSQNLRDREGPGVREPGPWGRQEALPERGSAMRVW